MKTEKKIQEKLRCIPFNSITPKELEKLRSNNRFLDYGSHIVMHDGKTPCVNHHFKESLKYRRFKKMDKIKEYLLKVCIASLSSEQVEKIQNHLEKNRAEKHLKVFDKLIKDDFFDFVGRMKTNLEKKKN